MQVLQTVLWIFSVQKNKHFFVSSVFSHIVTVLQQSAEGEGGPARQLGGGLGEAGRAPQGGAGAAGGQVRHRPLLMCSQPNTHIARL